MNVERTFDVGFILDVLSNEEILDSISEDGFNVEMFNFDVIKDTWLKIENEGVLIGVVQFKPMFTNCFDSHIHILPKFRKAYSAKSGEMILKWCSENMSGSLLYTNVPDFCVNVKNFLLSFGFKEIGILEKAWTKNGIQNDMTILTKRVL